MKRVAIIGAGITGLTAAFYLKKAGVDFTVFEKSDHTGGVISTKTKNGFIYETGPNTGTISNTETVELFEQLEKDVNIEHADETAKKRLILKNNRWEVLPGGIIQGIKTNLFTPKDKIRLLGEPFRKPGANPEETVAGLVKRRMGKSFLDYAIDPFISGIYAGDTNKLVTKYALPKLYNLEQQYGSFIGGAIKKGREKKSEQEKKVNKKIFSAKGGLSQIINALVKNIQPENILLNQNIEIEKTDTGYKIGDTSFSHVISTVNAGQIKAVLPFLADNVLASITNLNYAKVVEITLGFNHWKGIDINAFGGLIPSKEQKNILGILFMSTLFKNRAPEKGALITSFVGGTKKEFLTEMKETELLELLKPELTKLLGLPEFAPDLIQLHYHKNAIAQYDKSSKNRLLSIKNIEEQNPNLFLAGSIKDGVGMADRIKQATAIAKQIIQN
jgi:oxygen-dependent protoporphyrinogen oxidase